jgi:hypothetical protein
LQADAEHIRMLMDQYKCPYFRILVIGRANAGKTTILEKVCGVAQGTKPVIYDQNGDKLNFEPKKKLFAKVKHLFGGKIEPSYTHLTPSIEVSELYINWCAPAYQMLERNT